MLAVCLKALQRRLVHHSTHAAATTGPGIDGRTHCSEKRIEVVVRKVTEALDCGFVELMLCSGSEVVMLFFEIGNSMKDTSLVYISNFQSWPWPWP